MTILACPGRRLASLLLCVLVALLVVAAPTFVAGGAAPPKIEGSINTIVLALFQRALLAYQLSHPEFKPVTLTLNSGLAGGLAAATSGSYDFTVTSSSVPDTLKAGYPSLDSFPIMVSGIAPYYSLPTGTVGTAQLTLTTLAMCKIWRGNITYWSELTSMQLRSDDAEIKATNPALTFPHTAIVPLQLGFVNDGSAGASRLCTKVDPVWAATIGVTGLPILPNVTSLVQIPLAAGSAGIASYTLDNPGSIGMSSPVAALKAPRASMINQANKIVSAIPATVSQAFLELAANGILPGGNGFDLSNAQSAFAWPANICFWLMVDLSSVRTTCAAKAAVLKFLLWIYTSEVVVELANSFQIAMPPLLYLEQSGMLDRMRKSVLCDGASLVAADSTGATIRGNSIITNQLTFLTTMYRDVDSTYTYGFDAMADALALDRVAGGEIDFAVVDTNAITDSQIDIFRSPTTDASGNSVGGGMILPAYLVGVVPTFNLPTALKNYFATRTVSNDLGLPDLYPLKMDMETLALIFMGTITSWTDDRMIALNPQLQLWFDAVPLAPRKLLSVVCCTVPADALIAGTILTRALIKTNAIKGALGAASAAALTAKTIWPALAALHASQASNQTTVDREDTVYVKLVLQPGTVSYRQINTGVTNNQIEFQMVRTNRLQVVETVLPTPAAMAKCVPQSFLDDPSVFGTTIANPKRRDWVTDEPGCWPLIGAASIAIASAYSPLTAIGSSQTVKETDISSVTGRMFSPCIRAQKNLELLRWMQISPLLSPAAINSGLVRLADFAPIQSFVVNDRLNWATCDGKTILITLPIVWKVPSAVTVFAIVAVTLLILLCVITLIALYAYKSHSAIRGASPIFLAQVAIGIILLGASLVAWAAPVTEDSCMSFQWLVNLGFTLSFSPLFAKTWRIYQIFSAKKIRVVKITNSRLVWLVGGMLAFELIVLAAWTGVSPLRPTLFERSTTQADGAIKQTTHCAVDDSAGRAFLALEGTFKGVLLFLGSVYGFTTRKVSANFSESNTIAWAIYNVVFSGLVVGAILVFLDTLGDTLMWLVLFLMLWIACATWAFVFVPKFTAIVAAEKTNDPTHHSTSLASLSAKDGSVTFASITGFTVAQLQNYRVALEAQLIKVRQALGLSRQQREQENVVLVKQNTNASNNGNNLSSGGGDHSPKADPRRLKLFESDPKQPESGRLRGPSPSGGLRISPAPSTPTGTGTSTTMRYSATTTDVAGPSVRPAGSPPNGPRKTAFGVNAPTQPVRPSQQQSGAAHVRKGSSDQGNRILVAGHEENGIRIHSLPTGGSLESQSYDQPQQISSPSGPSPLLSPTAAEAAAAAASAIVVPHWDTEAAAGMNRDEQQPSPQPQVREPSRPTTAERERDGAASPVAAGAAPPTPTRVAISLAAKPSSRAH